MKPTTQAILKWLNNEVFLDQLDQFRQTNPEYVFSETSIEEAFSLFELNKSLLLQAIEKDIFDVQILYTKRQQIQNILKSIGSHLTQISQPQFKLNALQPHAAAHAQQIITGIIGLAEVVEGAKLQERLKGFADYTTETKELSKIKTRYYTLIKEIENATKIHKDSQDFYNGLQITADKLSKAIKELESEKTKTEKIKTEIDVTYQTIRKSNQEIEDKKVKISSFHNNIEEYQKSILQLETDAKAIVAKEGIISNLISQAEKALQLKTAEGISAAFSSHLVSASEKSKTEWWIIGAVVFIVAALGLTIWIVSGIGIEHPDAISSIIGRIVAVAIAITGATFCAKQYVKQKNIIEDYAYKAVLSKSIVAFTEEIKKRDETKVAEYLTHVLSEIHKDPLRQRNNNEDKNFGLDTQELIIKIFDKISKDGK